MSSRRMLLNSTNGKAEGLRCWLYALISLLASRSHTSVLECIVYNHTMLSTIVSRAFLLVQWPTSDIHSSQGCSDTSFSTLESDPRAKP